MRSFEKEIAAFYIGDAGAAVSLFYWLAVTSAWAGSQTIKANGVVGTFFTLGILAYFFGLAHALDADHLAAIDNSTRKLVQEQKPSHFTGFFFSLGHSTVVIALALLLMIATRAVAGAMPGLENVGNFVGTAVSGGFLYLIGFLNLVVLFQIRKLYRDARGGKSIDVDAELSEKGFMGRRIRALFKAVDKQSYMYPIGLLFGLGFDTATQTALLAISAAAAGIFLRVPLPSLMIFPLLFTAGMTAVDSTDGFFMNRAYQWAMTGNPIKKIWYNMTMTAVSIVVAYFVGTLELLGLLASEMGLTGFPWGWLEAVTSGTSWGEIGTMIIGIFALTWAISYLLYRRRPQQREVG